MPRPTARQAQQQDRPARQPRELPEAPAGGFPGYTHAMAWVQAHLPRVDADNEARVTTDKGPGYTYKYADLADVSYAVLPLLGRAGLVWTCLPTAVQDGRTMVLKYELRHTSGEHVSGVWPISGGTPQALGSSITYGRRYALMSVVGVFPGGEDDDGAAAEQSHRREDARSRTQQGTPASSTPAAPAAPAQPDVERFVADVEEAVSAGDLARIENLKHTAMPVYGIKPATELPGPGGEVMGALSYLRAAAAAAKVHAVAQEDAPARGRVERVRATPEQVAATLSQWETPPATAGTTEGAEQ